MHRAAIFALLILAGVAFAAGQLTTDVSTPPPAPPAIQSGQVLEHIDAIYDQQGNLIGGDIDGVSMDSLYWKDYYSVTYLKSSIKATSPSPTNRTAMAFQNNQSGLCMDPNGDYVYEVYGTNLRRFSTVNGSQTNYTLSYGGSNILGTDGTYLYRPSGTTIYKYTMTGGYVNSTTVNRSSGTYAFSVANDTVWIGSGYTYYGYACSRFNGGSITENVTWATGMSGATMMNVTYDGTYYYISCGGYSSNTFRRFYKNRTVYTSGTVYIDTRSCLAAGLPAVPGDVGTTRIIAPSDSLNYGDMVVPQAMVVNYGTLPQTFAVRLDVGTAYSNSQVVANLAGGDSVLVNFAAWTVNAAGSHAIKCSTQLSSDTVKSNDKATGSCFVRVFDVATTALVAPADTVDSTNVITPACSVFNYGNTAVSYKVRLHIGGYSDSATVIDHAAGTALPVTFANWTAGARGTYAVSCSTELALDDTSAGNDKQAGLVTVLVKDVSLEEIAGPLGSFPEGTAAQPRGTWRNNGTQVASFETWALLNDPTGARVYAQKFDMVGLIPGGTVQVGTFPACTLATPGTWTVRCSTSLIGDLAPGNDFLDSTFTVTPVSHEGGWVCAGVMPLSASGKEPKDGAWLASSAGDGLVYAAKGFKTGDFYSYDPVADAWTTRENWPAGKEAKGPYKGATGVSDGAGGVYAAKGNNTQGFWFYDAAANTWIQKTDVPLGPTNKKVKGGTDLAYYDGFVYLLKGYKDEFWRYDPAQDSWLQLPNAPAGVSARWDKGSWLANDGAGRLYAHKARYHEFYAFDIAAGSWGTALTPMPKESYTGKNKKSKDGGCGAFADGAIYALKGGNTNEFWRYDVAGNAWTEKETIPQVGLGSTKRKKVKGGADIVAVGSVFYATKGNKSLDIWQYTPSTLVDQPRPEQGGVMAGPAAIGGSRLAISPNPLGSGLLTISYSLAKAGNATVGVYDATGRCVVARSSWARSSSFTVSCLSTGVYLVKLTAPGFSATRKLVVQR
jgi:hypothetical protein